MSDVGPVFYASYPGRCDCGEPFDEGDEIRYVDGELLVQDCCGWQYDDEFATGGLGFEP